MRVPQEQMDRNHDRILEGASRLFRERGIENTRVADVMSSAGLTHGGFYRHFDDKETLVLAALQSAFDQIASMLETRADRGDPKAATAAFREHYLSKGHLDNPGQGCPVAALAGDVARGDNGLKAMFGAGVNRLVAALSRGRSVTSTATDDERRAAATRELATMAGAIMIARASDPETARRVLAACRSASPSD